MYNGYNISMSTISTKTTLANIVLFSADFNNIRLLYLVKICIVWDIAVQRVNCRGTVVKSLTVRGDVENMTVCRHFSQQQVVIYLTSATNCG